MACGRVPAATEFGIRLRGVPLGRRGAGCGPSGHMAGATGGAGPGLTQCSAAECWRTEMRGRFTLEYWRDGDWFVGRLLEVPGVFSQGATLEELRENIQ